MKFLQRIICAFCLTAPLLLLNAGGGELSGELVLDNGEICIKLIPDAGGRISSFGFSKGKNILKTDITLLEQKLPDPANMKEHFALNGHEIWAGPQENWWQFQDIYPGRKLKKDIWPPDPWVELGRFKVSSMTKDSIVLEGPESPVSGLKMIKYARLEGRSVILKTEAVNCRNSALSWDLWSNTRLDGDCKVYVRVDKNNFKLSIQIWSPETERNLQFELAEGFFSFVVPEKPDYDYVGKAFIGKSNGELYATGKDFIFKKTFKAASKAEVHPSQSPVEIYQKFSSDSKISILELEFHTPFTKIEPGKSISIEEKWTLYPRSADTNILHLIQAESGSEIR